MGADEFYTFPNPNIIGFKNITTFINVDREEQQYAIMDVAEWQKW